MKKARPGNTKRYFATYTSGAFGENHNAIRELGRLFDVVGNQNHCSGTFTGIAQSRHTQPGEVVQRGEGLIQKHNVFTPVRALASSTRLRMPPESWCG